MSPPKDPEKYELWKKRLSESMAGRKLSPDSIEKREATRKLRYESIYKNPTRNEKISSTLKGREITWGDKISKAKRGVPLKSELQKVAQCNASHACWNGNGSDMRRQKASERLRNRTLTEADKEYIRIRQIEYFNDVWYGGVKYQERRRNTSYCEKWTSNLRDRIRSYWGYKSVLSGKTKEDNKNRELCCHHIYYQKKACCEWDEDTQGYYCFIEGEKFYIRGDPNKFVTLTNEEHTRVNFNRRHWAEFFEELIEDNGGKCFYTKEEFSALKIVDNPITAAVSSQMRIPVPTAQSP